MAKLYMPPISINKSKLDNLANEIWKSAERLRGKFKAYEYQNVILPIIVVRRLECVLLKWREGRAAEIKKKQPDRSDKEIAKLVKQLELNPAQSPFSNKTNWTLRKVYEEDHTLLEENFRAYINGFSPNVDDIIEHFNYRATIGTVVKNNRLAPILNQYKELELGPDKLSPLEMGYIYEELLRRFSEQSGEEAGEHFTPREVIRLMVSSYSIFPFRIGTSPSMTPPAAQAACCRWQRSICLTARRLTRSARASTNTSRFMARNCRRRTTQFAKPTC
jgi:type I restriction enzyme M protein